MRSAYFRIGVSTGLVGLALGAFGTGCNQGGEGDRCNPLSSSPGCSSGLHCVQPPHCPENYCCPEGPSNDPFCQPGCNGGHAAMCAADPTQCDAATSGTDGGH
jgi:hypothetical protein